MLLSGLGLSIDLPNSWEGRIFRNPNPGDGTVSYPLLHAGNLALPPDNSNFAQRILQTMSFDNAMIAVVEYGPDSAGTALFTSGKWPPRVEIDDLNPAAFPGDRPANLAANQNFITVRIRAFCIYVVVGSDGRVAPRLQELNSVLATLTVT